MSSLDITTITPEQAQRLIALLDTILDAGRYEPTFFRRDPRETPEQERIRRAFCARVVREGRRA